MTPLIQRLKELQSQFHDLSDYKFSTATIRLLPLIIQTLEMLQGADKAYFDQIPYIDSLETKLAHQEKLLKEAKVYVVLRKNYLLLINGGPDSEEMNILKWLAELESLNAKEKE